ncbi:hypothetical protein, partial [Sulfurovum riftiae]|uniref:hypothetical protein n=1 Tax=Sulfurovum riftiae TaxID=1630136 RepID=UPI000A74D396
GFVNFPKAWASDRATILQVSEGGMIYLLSQARLYFRMSGDNITSDRTDGLIKLDAIIMFTQWLKENENIFQQKPNMGFYKHLYKKVEEYVLNLEFDIKLFRKLYTLRKICMVSNKIKSPKFN